MSSEWDTLEMTKKYTTSLVRDKLSKTVNKMPEPKRSIEDGMDERIIQMREIKKKHVLRSIDIVEELKIQGYPITKSALSAYLQGNVRGTDSRKWSSIAGKEIVNNHIDDLLAQFIKMDKRLSKAYKRFQNKSMRQIMDGWFKAIEHVEGSRERYLAKITGVDFTTIFKWYQDDRKPRTLKYLVGLQDIIDQYSAKNKLKAIPVAKAKRPDLSKIRLTPQRQAAIKSSPAS